MASIYIHIPYCERKCIYCDFYSVEGLPSKDRFLSALRDEIDLYAIRYADAEPIDTIFFGGGTPSLLHPSTIAAILDQLRGRYHVAPDAEITMEANPGTITRESLSGYLSAGVNRMSIGIQSFQQSDLEFLGRIHSAQQAETAVKDAYGAGFTNVNVDLIFSLPGQTRTRWEDTLKRALDLRPVHISAYSLIVEENTPLYSMVKRHIVTPVTEIIDAAMYESTMDILARHGYRHYEISNYALPGFECRHNLNYWNHSNYLSFGPSAHSFWRITATTARRWWNDRSIDRYCAGIESGPDLPGGEETIDRDQMIDEEIFLGMRCGVLNLPRLKIVYGFEFPRVQNELLDSYIREGYMTRDGDIIGLTPRGFMVCDALIENLVHF
jgi:oxygen-independent coproporphyrinogen III oxidase